MGSKPKVLVAMSGGVDSSVAAALVKEQGYEVTGVTMRIWEGDDSLQAGRHHGCYGPGEQEDIEDAIRVSQILDIPFKVIDLTREYQSVVLDYFTQEYLSGRTPNPCVRCNRRVKFGALIEKAREIGIDFDFIVSGHYARVDRNETTSRYQLRKALDLKKDQSYFLAFLSQEQLGSLKFPLGEFTKTEVREIARRHGLPVAEKSDSQNFVCGDYSTVFKVENRVGPIIDKTGKEIGQHRGIQYYTIGQHKGLGIPSQDPLYVISIDPSHNVLVVGEKNDLFKDELKAGELNWVSIPILAQPLEVKARIRYAHKEAAATIIPADTDMVKVKFKEPQISITPGQAVVFYDEDTVLGAGIIQSPG